MAQNFDKAATLDEARARHAEIDKTLSKLAACAHDWPALWAELTQQHTPVTQGSDMASAVRATIPADLVTALAAADDIAAAFAFVACAMSVAQIDPSDDFAMREALKRAWQVVLERKNQADQLQEGFGCDDSLAWNTLRKMNSAPRSAELVRKMLAIAQLAGAMHQAMRTVGRPTPTNDPHIVKGVEQGSELERLMPAELAKLADPRMGSMQTMKLLQGQADQRKMAGITQTTRGPLVIALDESGSMHDEGSASGRNTWAKAAALALLRIAHSEGRTVRVVHFSNATATHDVPAGDTSAMQTMIMHFLSGGTDFVRALSVAHKAVKDLAKDGYPGADIVFVSDGECSDESGAQARMLDAIAADQIKVWTVAIGQHFRDTHPLRARAERYVYAHDRDLANRTRAIDLATGLTAAAAPSGNLN